MPVDRFYHPKIFQPGSQLLLEGQELHHFATVMRNRAGDLVELVNGQGQRANARVVSISDKCASLQLLDVENAAIPKQKLILAQAIPRLNRLECILEKGTELGMSEIWLFPGVHSEKKTLSENQKERAKTILINAMKQSGTLFLPVLILMPPLKQWRSIAASAFFGDIREHSPSFEDAWEKNSKQHDIIFFIGPESGFTAEEINCLEKLGARGVKLHPNILRTDTAAISALCLASQKIYTC